MRVGALFVPLNLPVAGRSPQRAFASHPFQLTRTALSLQMCCDRCSNAPLETRVQPIQASPCAQDLRSGVLHIFTRLRFPAMLLSPCLSVSGQAGVLKGYVALNLLLFKGYLTSAETAHTDVLSSHYSHS